MDIVFGIMCFILGYFISFFIHSQFIHYVAKKKKKKAHKGTIPLWTGTKTVFKKWNPLKRKKK